MKRILGIIVALLAAPAFADVTTAIATSKAEAEAASLAVAGNKNVQQTVLPVNPAHTSTDLKNVPGLGGIGGWAYAAPSGPCLGPSETKQGGAQAVWMGAGVGGQYGEGASNLDWGCVVLRDMNAASLMCDKGVRKACADRDALYEMLPSITAARAGSLPNYAKAQVVAMPAAAPAPAPRSAAPAQTASVRQPTNCVVDEYIARRQGSPVCK